MHRIPFVYMLHKIILMNGCAPLYTPVTILWFVDKVKEKFAVLVAALEGETYVVGTVVVVVPDADDFGAVEHLLVTFVTLSGIVLAFHIVSTHNILSIDRHPIYVCSVSCPNKNIRVISIHRLEDI